MKQIYAILTILTAMFLAACSTLGFGDDSGSSNYQSAQTTNTALTSKQSVEGRYSIPTIPQTQADQTISPTPPGSLQPVTTTTTTTQPVGQTTTQTVVQQSAPTATNQVAKLTPGGLLISQNYNQAWQSVGKALSSSGYQIMEKDSSLGTYYVVDKSSTGKVQRDAPIYQVKLQNSGNATIVTLLNSQNQPTDSSITNRILTNVRDRIN